MTAIAGREQLCRVRGIKICFEEIGDPDGEPLLLIMGLGGQMIAWPTEFCERLAARGFRVIRFDNRDCGRSAHFADTQPPSTWSILRRRPRPAGYTLDDMAADAIGLLDHLEIQRAHLIGASMGGMIAQVIATRAPRRVRSLTSIRSSTGSRWRGRPRARMWPLLLGGSATDRPSYEERFVRFAKAIASFPPRRSRGRSSPLRAHAARARRSRTRVKRSPSRNGQSAPRTRRGRSHSAQQERPHSRPRPPVPAAPRAGPDRRQRAHPPGARVAISWAIVPPIDAPTTAHADPEGRAGRRRRPPCHES